MKSDDEEGEADHEESDHERTDNETESGSSNTLESPPTKRMDTPYEPKSIPHIVTQEVARVELQLEVR